MNTMQLISTRAIEHGAVLFPAAGALFLLAALALWRRGSLPRRAGSVLCALLIVPCAFGFFFTRTVHATIARRAGEFSFRLLDSAQARKLSDYKGQVVVLNFWATWCPPCIEEMPALEQLAQRYAESGVVVLTVSDESPAKLRPPGPTARVGAYIASDIVPVSGIEKMACQGRPTTLIVDRSGQVRDTLIGGHTLEDFEAAVKRAL